MGPGIDTHVTVWCPPWFDVRWGGFAQTEVHFFLQV